MVKNQRLSVIILFSRPLFTKTSLSNSLPERLVYLHSCRKMRFVDLDSINVHQRPTKASLPDNRRLRASRLDVFMVTVQSSNATAYQPSNKQNGGSKMTT